MSDKDLGDMTAQQVMDWTSRHVWERVELAREEHKLPAGFNTKGREEFRTKAEPVNQAILSGLCRLRDMAGNPDGKASVRQALNTVERLEREVGQFLASIAQIRQDLEAQAASKKD